MERSMARTVDELLVLLQEGDESAADELKGLLATNAQKAAKAERELKMKTDTGLRERYPRALRAFDKGKLRLSDDMDDDAVIAALKDKEEEYAELGVPIDPALAQKPATPVEDGGDMPVTPAVDAAKALAGGRGPTSPGGQPRDLVAEYFDLMKGSTEHDRARANSILVELNQTRQQDKIDQITAALEARPIILKGI
jgi:hypothetical protein